MFNRSVRIMNLFGFQVKVDSSWVFLAMLILWTLAMGYFPAAVPGQNWNVYWLMGLAGALGLFISLVLHEFAHSLAARRMGLEIRGITLFIFGGVAEMETEPPNARTEFWMAIAGPLTSVLIGAVMLAVGSVGIWPAPVAAVINYLWQINFILAAFNMLPGFPLDGGRILRSALWAWSRDLRWATVWAVRAGIGISYLLMIGGIFSFFFGNIVSGIWWFLIALFLLSAAKSSEVHVRMKEALEGELIREHMNAAPVTMPSYLTVKQAVESYFYRYNERSFPVVDDGHLLGEVRLSDIKTIPREKWDTTTIANVYRSKSPSNTVHPDADALEVLEKMGREGAECILVSERELDGIVSLKELLNHVAIKLELGDDNHSHPSRA